MKRLVTSSLDFYPNLLKLLTQDSFSDLSALITAYFTLIACYYLLLPVIILLL